MGKYPLALYIGRFQPFHNGHLFALKQALKAAEKVLIVIGSSNVSDEKNPFGVPQRRKILEAVIAAELPRDKVEDVIELPDTSDEAWVANVISQVVAKGYNPKDVVVTGNNEWVNGLLEPAGFVIHRIGYFNRNELEGIKIRKLIKTHDEEWKSRVPKVVREIIEEVE